MWFVLQIQANAKTLETEQNWEERNDKNHILFSAKFFVYLSTLPPAHLFAARGRLQRWEADITGLQKSQFSNSLVNWEKFRSTVQACFQKTQFSIFLINWEKLRSPARAAFKNPKTSLWIGNNLEVQPKANARKSQFCIHVWTGKNYILI